jgi:hypothetical protein
VQRRGAPDVGDLAVVEAEPPRDPLDEERDVVDRRRCRASNPPGSARRVR